MDELNQSTRTCKVRILEYVRYWDAFGMARILDGLHACRIDCKKNIYVPCIEYMYVSCDVAAGCTLYGT
jgi:hypothetical protein